MAKFITSNTSYLEREGMEEPREGKKAGFAWGKAARRICLHGNPSRVRIVGGGALASPYNCRLPLEARGHGRLPACRRTRRRFPLFFSLSPTSHTPFTASKDGVFSPCPVVSVPIPFKGPVGVALRNLPQTAPLPSARIAPGNPTPVFTALTPEPSLLTSEPNPRPLPLPLRTRRPQVCRI